MSTPQWRQTATQKQIGHGFHATFEGLNLRQPIHPDVTQPRPDLTGEIEYITSRIIHSLFLVFVASANKEPDMSKIPDKQDACTQHR